MKIVKVSDIKSNPINEQIYDLSGIEELAASIDEVGLLQAITVNQSHTVISGGVHLIRSNQLLFLRR